MPGYTIAGDVGHAGPACRSSLPPTWRWADPEEVKKERGSIFC